MSVLVNSNRTRWLPWLALSSLLALGVAGYWVAAHSTLGYKVRTKATRLLERYMPPPAPAAKPGLPAVPRQFKWKETIYKGGLSETWFDYGWAEHEIKGPGPAKVRFSKLAAWTIYGREHVGEFGAVILRMKAPKSFGDFLEVSLQMDGPSGFEKIQVGSRYRFPLPNGWEQIVVPMYELNPHGLAFDRVRLRALSAVSDEWVLLDEIGLAEPFAGGPPRIRYPELDMKAVVRCDQPGHPISPLIYGVADIKAAPELNPGAFRLGGNGMSRFNWKLDNVWNTGLDYYFENVKLSFTWRGVVQQAADRGVPLSITLPMLGWVAKDTTSSSFPEATFGKQQSSDSWRAGAGNGLTPEGKELTPKSPTLTSVAAPPEFVAEWVSVLRAEAEKAGRTARRSYILDNEPGLWNSTHRDVHPEPLTYDELLDRTLRFGSAVRKADPSAEIVGPAEWGWSNYFWSSKDAKEGFNERPDRRAHGDIPLLDWYLKKLADYEKRTGVRILDVVDLHFYPQSRGLYEPGGGGDTDADAAQRRIRSTRSLWDPSYLDESWISEKIMLIPRLKKIIADNYPGRAISIGEWNFGAEGHISGAVAIAESLGRFAEAGIRSAYYWTAPKKGIPAYFGFTAFRNFDGAGGKFLENFVPSDAPDDVSVFVSRDAKGKHLVLVAINRDAEHAKRAHFDVASCGQASSKKIFVYAGYRQGFEVKKGGGPGVEALLPPLSIAVIDLQLSP